MRRYGITNEMRMTMTETFREHTKKETNDILIFDNNKGTLRNVIT